MTGNHETILANLTRLYYSGLTETHAPVSLRLGSVLYRALHKVLGPVPLGGVDADGPYIWFKAIRVREAPEFTPLGSAVITAPRVGTAGMAKQQWRPIETAPKDGTILDVWLGGASPVEVDFYCTPGTRRSSGWAWRQGKFRPCAGLHVVTALVEPTHWMPLPAPPKEKE